MPRKRPTLFEVRYSEKPNRDLHWRIVGFVNGKRTQFWFKSEKGAKAAAADKNAEITAYGTQVALSAADRVRAINATERLASFGKTIDDAVNFYLTHLSYLSSSVPFSALATQVRSEFKRRVEANEVSERHVESLNETLKKLEAKFGERLVSEIRVEEVREWLVGLKLAAKTRNKHRGYAGQVFNLAVDYGYISANPVTKIKKFRERSNEEDGEISILSSTETERLFLAASPKVIPFLTLSFFCGIRRATLERLDWADVKIAEKRVIVPRYKGKNQLRYRVTLTDNALAWLRPYVRQNGSLLVPSQATNRPGVEKGRPSETGTRRLILEAAREAGVTLPDNAGRNTFISMHVAHYESVDKTALETDNSAAVIKKDYLDIVTREDAAKYWQIRPRRAAS
jgi:integrase